MRKNLRWVVLGLLLLFVGSTVFPLLTDTAGCAPSTPPANVVEQKPLPQIEIPKFSADSAYVWTEKIVSMSPRVTGSDGAKRVKTWIIAQFKRFGVETIEQNFTATVYTGAKLPATNIIARINPQATLRILLSAHWDSRPFADKDSDSTQQKRPILGADDSASSLAMLLELARQLQANPLSNVGVDIVFFDAEDYGNPTPPKTEEEERLQNLTWCLGSQHWAKNPHIPANSFRYGVNLDMAGAKGARFTKEQVSMRYASNVVEKVWRVARNLSYTSLFVDDSSKGPMIDDHLFVNEIARIPTIDIINHPADSYFGKYWHTHDDDMDVIDRETMRAVGQTVLSVLHYENVNGFQ